MILTLTHDERNKIVQALSILLEDYREISAAVISPMLKREYTNDAYDLESLIQRVGTLTETPSATEMHGHILKLMRDGYKIEAIKYVRTHKALGLKEAKDYVEQVEREAGI